MTYIAHCIIARAHLHATLQLHLYMYSFTAHTHTHRQLTMYMYTHTHSSPCTWGCLVSWPWQSGDHSTLHWAPPGSFHAESWSQPLLPVHTIMTQYQSIILKLSSIVKGRRSSSRQYIISCTQTHTHTQYVIACIAMLTQQTIWLRANRTLYHVAKNSSN